MVGRFSGIRRGRSAVLWRNSWLFFGGDGIRAPAQKGEAAESVIARLPSAKPSATRGSGGSGTVTRWMETRR